MREREILHRRQQLRLEAEKNSDCGGGEELGGCLEQNGGSSGGNDAAGSVKCGPIGPTEPGKAGPSSQPANPPS